MNHLLLGALYQEVGTEAGQEQLTQQYAGFIRDAYRVSELVQQMENKEDPSLKSDIDAFYKTVGDCGMVFQLGGASGSLKEASSLAFLKPEDLRLTMLEQMHGELSKSLQGMILHSGGNMELMQAGFALQNGFIESLLALKTEAAANLAKSRNTAAEVPAAAPQTASVESGVSLKAVEEPAPAAPVTEKTETAKGEAAAAPAPETEIPQPDILEESKEPQKPAAEDAAEEVTEEGSQTAAEAEEDAEQPEMLSEEETEMEDPEEDDPEEEIALLIRILQANPYYDRCPLSDVMMEILHLSTELLPEMVKFDGEYRDLRTELQNIRGKAFDCAEDTLFLFSEDEQGKLRYLNREEMDEMGTRFLDLNADLMDLCDAVEASGIAEFPMDTVQQIRKEISRFTTDFFNANAFVLKYAEKLEKNAVRPFSIYDLLGVLAPEGGNGLVYLAKLLREQAEEVTESEASEAVHAVTSEVTELIEQGLKELLHFHVGGGLFTPLATEEIRNLANIYAEKEEHLGEYIRDTLPQMDYITVAELQYLNLVREIHGRIARMSELFGLLVESERGDRLGGDLAEYVEYALKRRQEEQTGAELPPSRYTREEESFFYYAINCKQMMDHNALLISFLLEDPQDQHGVLLLSRPFNEKSLEEADKWEEEDLSGLAWVDGRRDLSGVPKYRAQLKALDEPLHIFQYATKNDWQFFMEVIDLSFKYLPVYMKKATVLLGEDADATTEQEINIAELIRAELELWREDGGTVADYWKASGGFEGVMRRLPGFVSFANPQDENRVNGFLKRLEQNLENAGLGAEAQAALADAQIPNGYNEAVAREWTNELFGNQDRSIRHNLMTEEKIPLAKERGNRERFMNVTVSYARANADAEEARGCDFYTTTRDFRISSFVGSFQNIERNMEMIRSSLDGMEENEIAEVFAAERKNHFGYAMDQRIDQARKILQRVDEDVLFQMQQGMTQYDDNSSLSSRSVFENAASMEAVADLQVADYLTGVRKRGVDDFRLGFCRQDGRIRFSGFGAADRADERPFTKWYADEEEKLLVQPENMLVMSKDMYEKLLRWKKGLEDPKRSRLSEVEKMIFDAMDPEVQRGFERRLNHVLEVTEDPQAMIYADRKHRLLGDVFAPDVKPGSIRVVDSETFELLRLEDLLLEKKVRFRGENPEGIGNLFDALAEISQRCSDALLDKVIASLVGSKEKHFGEGLGTLGEIMYREQKKTYDLSMNNYLAERICMNVARFYGDTAVIAEESRQKENAMLRFFGDGMIFQEVAEAAEEMRDAILKNRRLVADERQMTAAGEEGFDNERIGEIRAYQEERLVHAQKVADVQGHAYPEELPVITQDPYLYCRSLKAMETFRNKLRTYLEKRRMSVNETGKERFAAMLELFNRTNRAIVAYAALTGDTSVMPVVAKIAEDKPNVTVFSDMFASPAEFEMITPYYYETKNKKKQPAQSGTKTGSSSASGTAAAADRQSAATSSSSGGRAVEQGGRRMVSLSALMEESSSGRRGR